MSSFTDHLNYTSVGNGLYSTNSKFRFYLNDNLKGEYVDIEAHTIFNGASIPKPVKELFNWNPMDIRWLQATVLHDALVGEFETKVKTSLNRELSWKEAASWFNAALKIKNKQHNCPDSYRLIFYFAILFYGHITSKE